MPKIDVDGLIFDFRDSWTASKYDGWTFYRNRWSRMWNGIRAVDILAVDPNGTGWLIEVKDYTTLSTGTDERPSASDLALTVAKKVFDTLAAILPAGAGASDEGEKSLARSLATTVKLRVALHLEQPGTKSRLRPHAIDPANIRQQLRRLLKPVDAHPLVAAMAQTGDLAWTVARP